MVRRYWGINQKTFLVECVERTLGGQITMWRGETYLRRPAPRQGESRDQFATLFGLRDVEVIDQAGFGTPAEQGARRKLETLSLRYRDQDVAG